MSNFFIFLIALLILAFIWLVWMHQVLFHALHQVEQKRSILQEDFNKRRDILPRLLEAFRANREINEAWRGLMSARQEFHTLIEPELGREEHFESQLKQFLLGTHLNRLDFLEAKKDIQDMEGHLTQAKEDFHVAIEHFNRLRKRFPYSVASQVFGFHEVEGRA